jgi:autotransporter adhesin
VPERASAPAWRRQLAAGVCALALAIALVPGAPMSVAQAQSVVCDSGLIAGDDALGSATGSEATACGFGADASGANSSAYGNDSTASGTFSSAYGLNSEASNTNSSAFGRASTASGSGSSAFGGLSTASGSGSSAFGNLSTASGSSSVAIGNFANATFDNSAAFGSGATTTRDNQQVFGTAANTYTMTGVTSAASRTAQGAPTHIVTSNADGDLAAHTFADLGLASPGDLGAINSRLSDLTTESRRGIATAMAMTTAPLPSAVGRTSWAMNLAHFRGESAFGASLAHRLNTPDPLALTGGYSYGGGKAHGVRVGLQGEF